MTQSTSSPRSASNTPPIAAGVAADACELAGFLADQHPLDVEAASWQVRQQDGLSADEAAELQQWLKADRSHRDAFVRFDGMWDRLDALPAEEVVRLKAALPAAKAAADTGAADALVSDVSPEDAADVSPTPPHARLPPRVATRPRRGHRAGLAGLMPNLLTAGTAAAIGCTAWIGWTYWQQQPVFTQSYATTRGQQLDVRLPDGSTLKLDTATRAEVTLYRQRREVRLPEGQAMFTVKADASQPFDVLAGPLRITVVGTRFSVRNTPTGMGADGVSVVVEEGRVRVARADATAATSDATAQALAKVAELTAGQSIQANAQGQWEQIKAQSPGGAMLWREGRVNFDRTPLAQALAVFERYGATNVVIKDPKVAALRINGSFDLRQARTFTGALPQVLPVRLREQGGVTEVISSR